MIIDEVADVIAGQIMPRVQVQKDEKGQACKKVRVLSPRAINEGNVVRENIGEALLGRDVDRKKYTQAGDIVVKLSTPYDAAYIENECAGLLIPSFCAVIRVRKGYEQFTSAFLCAYMNSSYVAEMLREAVSGTARPMIRISDVRAISLPVMEEKDMLQIGEMYMLSRRKRELLARLGETEKEIMDAVVLKAVMGK